MRVLLLLTSFVVVIWSFLVDIPEPRDLALELNEEEFEDYLDFWVAIEQSRHTSESNIFPRSGCQIRVNGDLGLPQPVYIYNGDYIVPTGNTGVINHKTGEQVYIACTGANQTIHHPNITIFTSNGIATCVNHTKVSGAGWLNGNGEFGQLTCSAHSVHEAEYTGEICYNNNQVIRIGYNVNGVFCPKFWSCFDANRLEVLYVWVHQDPPNAVYQIGVPRPRWLAGIFFPDVDINSLYTQVQQKARITDLFGKELADKYVTTTQFLSRGHLAAKTDFIFATGQRSSFYFINAAPQWQPFNAGNWNRIEKDLRARVADAGYYTIVYTGTWGVSQLRDQNDTLVDIYLHRDANNNPQLPVPLYYYKVVYEPNLYLGTAFVSINNPYYTEEECYALAFCEDRCRGNSDFDWLRWEPDRIDIGYSFCCDVDDFRLTVPHLPAFTVNGLLS